MPRTDRSTDAQSDPEDACAAWAGVPNDGRPEPGEEPRPAGPTETEHYAAHLRESASSMFLYTAMAPLLKGIDSSAYKLYRDRLLADSGSPADPVEVMLLEQLGLAHFCTCLLAAKTTNAGQVNVSGVYASAYARVMAEFRRSALALQAYRHANRQLARDPARNAVSEAAEPTDDLPGGNRRDGELIANTEAPDAGDSIIPYARPEAV